MIFGLAGVDYAQIAEILVSLPFWLVWRLAEQTCAVEVQHLCRTIADGINHTTFDDLGHHSYCILTRIKIFFKHLRYNFVLIYNLGL